MSSTARGADRVQDDFYPTPLKTIQAILPHLTTPDVVLEPAAGDGAIVRAVRDHWPDCEVSGIEVDHYRALRGGVQEGDFLAMDHWEADALSALIITNPPYVIAQKFVEHAIRLACIRGAYANSCNTYEVAMLLRLGFSASASRREFWRKHPADVYVLPQRPSFSCSQKCKASGCRWRVTQALDAPRHKVCPECGGPVQTSTADSCDYGWFVWGTNRGGHWQVIDV